MGGAGHFYPEAGSVINYTSEIDRNGLYRLSPVGEMTSELSAFAEKNRDIGISYAPFGIVLDYYHGMFPGDTRIAEKSVFGALPYNDGDQMTLDLLESFFPGSFETIDCDESTYQVNGPYGDTCDVLLQNASSEVLESYPCLILSGDITLSKSEAERYKSYAENGGTLILNTAYLKFFPEYKNKSGSIAVGDGTVIVYGPDYDISLLDAIIKEQLNRLLPFKVSGSAEYLINIKDGSLIVTLINNDGYYYNRITGEYIDTDAAGRVTVEYNGTARVKRIKELWSDEYIASGKQNKKSCTVTLSPGEVKILEFIF